MERLVMLPFSVGCVSNSSVAVEVPTTRPHSCTCTCTSRHGAAYINRSVKEVASHSLQLDSHNSTTTHHHHHHHHHQHPEQTPPPAGMKLHSSLDHISSGIHRLVKTISFIFAYKEEGAEEEDMEIGFPSDVKHVTHIGPAPDGAYSSASSSSSSSSSSVVNYTDFAQMMNATTPVPAGFNIMHMNLIHHSPILKDLAAPRDDVAQAVTANSSSDHLVKPPELSA